MKTTEMIIMMMIYGVFPLSFSHAQTVPCSLLLYRPGGLFLFCEGEVIRHHHYVCLYEHFTKSFINKTLRKYNRNNNNNRGLGIAE